MEQIQKLAELIAGQTDVDGAYCTAVNGLYLNRRSNPCSPRNTIQKAVFCVVAQGSKSVLLNNEQYVYASGKYLVLSLDLPLVGEVLQATRKEPMLCLSMELDFAEISSLLLETSFPATTQARTQKSLYVSTLDDELLDALIRYMCLLQKPAQIPVMAPLLRREIYYKLLLAEQGGLLHRLATENSQLQRITAGLDWLRKNALRPIRMQELARVVNMSPSTMHAWFKSVTSMSPLQFQKQLRLQEARRILLTETTDATTAAQRVGYESPSQFSREYRRLFGEPPLRDIERLRATHGAVDGPLRKQVRST